MVDEVAKIGFEVDSTGIDEATQKVRDFGKASQETGAQVDQASTSSARAKSAYSDVGAAAQSSTTSVKSSAAALKDHNSASAETEGLLSRMTGGWISFGSGASKAAEGTHSAHSATTQLRHEMHALLPVMEATGASAGGLHGYMLALRSGMALFASMLAGVFIVELEKASDEVMVLQKNFESLFGTVSGKRFFEEMEGSAAKLGTTVANIAPGAESAAKSIAKMADAFGMRMAPGAAAGTNLFGIDAVNVVETMTELFEQGGVRIGKAKTEVQSFFESIRKGGTLTEEEFDKLPNNVQNAITKAFGYGEGIAATTRFDALLKQQPINARDLMIALTNISPAVHRAFEAAPIMTMAQGWDRVVGAVQRVWEELGKTTTLTNVKTLFADIEKGIMDWVHGGGVERVGELIRGVVDGVTALNHALVTTFAGDSLAGFKTFVTLLAGLKSMPLGALTGLALFSTDITKIAENAGLAKDKVDLLSFGLKAITTAIAFGINPFLGLIVGATQFSDELKGLLEWAKEFYDKMVELGHGDFFAGLGTYMEDFFARLLTKAKEFAVNLGNEIRAQLPDWLGGGAPAGGAAQAAAMAPHAAGAESADALTKFLADQYKQTTIEFRPEELKATLDSIWGFFSRILEKVSPVTPAAAGELPATSTAPDKTSAVDDSLQKLSDTSAETTTKTNQLTAATTDLGSKLDAAKAPVDSISTDMDKVATSSKTLADNTEPLAAGQTSAATAAANLTSNLGTLTVAMQTASAAAASSQSSFAQDTAGIQAPVGGATADIGMAQQGGLFVVGGSGAPDSIPLTGMVSPGEVVAVIPPAAQDANLLQTLASAVGSSPINLATGGAMALSTISPPTTAPTDSSPGATAIANTLNVAGFLEQIGRQLYLNQLLQSVQANQAATASAPTTSIASGTMLPAGAALSMDPAGMIRDLYARMGAPAGYGPLSYGGMRSTGGGGGGKGGGAAGSRAAGTGASDTGDTSTPAAATSRAAAASTSGAGGIKQITAMGGSGIIPTTIADTKAAMMSEEQLIQYIMATQFGPTVDFGVAGLAGAGTGGGYGVAGAGPETYAFGPAPSPTAFDYGATAGVGSGGVISALTAPSYSSSDFLGGMSGGSADVPDISGSSGFWDFLSNLGQGVQSTEGVDLSGGYSGAYDYGAGGDYGGVFDTGYSQTGSLSVIPESGAPPDSINLAGKVSPGEVVAVIPKSAASNPSLMNTLKTATGSSIAAPKNYSTLEAVAKGGVVGLSPAVNQSAMNASRAATQATNLPLTTDQVNAALNRVQQLIAYQAALNALQNQVATQAIAPTSPLAAAGGGGGGGGGSKGKDQGWQAIPQVQGPIPPDANIVPARKGAGAVATPAARVVMAGAPTATTSADYWKEFTNSMSQLSDSLGQVVDFYAPAGPSFTQYAGDYTSGAFDNSYQSAVSGFMDLSSAMYAQAGWGTAPSFSDYTSTYTGGSFDSVLSSGVGYYDTGYAGGSDYGAGFDMGGDYMGGGATGLSFKVPGAGTTDSVRTSMDLTPGESVFTVPPSGEAPSWYRGEQGQPQAMPPQAIGGLSKAAVHIENVNIQTPNPAGFGSSMSRTAIARVFSGIGV